MKEIASAFKTFNFLPQIWDSRKVTGKHENKSLLKTKDYNFCLLVLVLTSTAVYGLALSSLIPNGHSLLSTRSENEPPQRLKFHGGGPSWKCLLALSHF